MLFADDAVFLCSDKTRIGLKHKSETELRKIENWIVANKLNMNFVKTNYIIFSNKTKANKHENVCICATNGATTEQKSFLGNNTQKGL